MRFDELKIEQLKKELSKMELPTTGNKVELQKRLVEEFKRRGIDISNYDFDGKEEELEVSTLPSKGPIDINGMFSALMEQMAEVRGSSRANDEKHLANNKKLLAKVEQSSRANNEKLLAEVQESSRATKNRLQEISDAINKRVDGIEEGISDFDTKLQEVETKVRQLEIKGVDEKLQNLEAEIKSLKCQEMPVRVVPEVSNRSKPPSFDGNTSFSIFKFQFETVASRNMWNSEDKAAELILALKGTAAEVIETVPICSRTSYDEIMAALQRKYGGEHKQQI